METLEMISALDTLVNILDGLVAELEDTPAEAATPGSDLLSDYHKLHNRVFRNDRSLAVFLILDVGVKHVSDDLEVGQGVQSHHASGFAVVTSDEPAHT